MRHFVLIVLLALQAADPMARAGSGNLHAATAAGLTGKERLSDKASDQQRLDDCKVPPARRTRPRPTGCPWDRGYGTSPPTHAARNGGHDIGFPVRAAGAGNRD